MLLGSLGRSSQLTTDYGPLTAKPGFLRPLRHERHAPRIWPRRWMDRTFELGFVRVIVPARIGFVRAIPARASIFQSRSEPHNRQFRYGQSSSYVQRGHRFVSKKPRRGSRPLSSEVSERPSVPIIESWLMWGFLRPLRHERHARHESRHGCALGSRPRFVRSPFGLRPDSTGATGALAHARLREMTNMGAARDSRSVGSTRLNHEPGDALRHSLGSFRSNDSGPIT
jgi:hypothetical protein